MKTVYLVRHSKAQQQHPSGDRFRALTAEGVARIAAMLPRAVENGFRAELALSSPYVRAVETRDRFAGVMGATRAEVSTAFAPDASAHDACIELAVWAEQYSSIALFTHNPLVGEIADLLLIPRSLLDLEFHTPTILALGFEHGTGLRQGKPLWVLHP